MSPRPLLAFTFAFAVAVGGAGCCGSVRKVQSCKTLVATVKRSHDEIDKHKSLDDAEDLAAAARTLRSEAATVRSLRLSDKQVGQYAKDYAKLLDSLGRNFRALSDAIRTKNAKRRSEIHTELRGYGRREAVILKKINQRCASL